MAQGNGSKPDLQEALFDFDDDSTASAGKSKDEAPAGASGVKETRKPAEKAAAKKASPPAEEKAPAPVKAMAKETPAPEQPAAAAPLEPAKKPVPVSDPVAVEPASSQVEVDSGDLDSMEPLPDEGPRVMELGHNTEGAWKVMDSGERIELNEKDWREELNRQFSKEKHAEAV